MKMPMPRKSSIDFRCSKKFRFLMEISKNSKNLKNKRKYAILIAFVVAAVITPPDVISQILLAVPIIVLYEISIWCSKIIEED